MTLYASRAAADLAADRLKIYAQPQRLMILSRLLDLADVVKTRRSSRQVYYALASDDVVTCVQGIEAMFGASDGAAPALQSFLRSVGRGPLPIGPRVAAAFARVAPPRGTRG